MPAYREEIYTTQTQADFSVLLDIRSIIPIQQ